MDKELDEGFLLDGEKVDNCSSFYDDENLYEKRRKREEEVLISNRRGCLLRGIIMGTIVIDAIYKINKKRPIINAMILSIGLIGSTYYFLESHVASKNLKVLRKSMK